MTINELSITLSDAYSLENLNKISVTLINLYKNQQYSILQKNGELINDFTAIEFSPEGNGFSKLIMLYHPDKLAYYQNEIKRCVENSNFDGLLDLGIGEVQFSTKLLRGKLGLGLFDDQFCVEFF